MAVSKAQLTLPKIVIDGVHRSIDPILSARAKGKGVCSSKTRDERRQFYLLMVADLWKLGFKIRKLESLSGKHVTALMEHWHQQGVCAGTLHTRRSMINYLCAALGKKNVVKNIWEYLPAEAIKRVSVNKESKSWENNGVNPLQVIERAREIDERLAVMLALQHHFGLRMKESVELRPSNALIMRGTCLEIYEGTKGGRPRTLPILTDEQRRVIEWACQVASTGRSRRMRWPNLSWQQAKNRFYHLVRTRLGISREELGVTAHGLRHGYAQDRYRQQTGLPSPVEGGALDRIDRETHDDARITVSHELGHNRPQVTASYFGSYGHLMRLVPEKPTLASRFASQRQRVAEVTYKHGPFNLSVKEGA